MTCIRNSTGISSLAIALVLIHGNHTSSVLMSIGLCVRFERSQCSKFTHLWVSHVPVDERSWWQSSISWGGWAPESLGIYWGRKLLGLLKFYKKVQHQKWLPQTNGNPNKSMCEVSLQTRESMRPPPKTNESKRLLENSNHLLNRIPTSSFMMDFAAIVMLVNSGGLSPRWGHHPRGTSLHLRLPQFRLDKTLVALLDENAILVPKHRLSWYKYIQLASYSATPTLSLWMNHCNC